MAFLAKLNITADAALELVKLYYVANKLQYNSSGCAKYAMAFNESILKASVALDLTATEKYKMLGHIYWAIRILAESTKDDIDVNELVRSTNPIFQVCGDEEEVNDDEDGETSPSVIVLKKAIEAYITPQAYTLQGLDCNCNGKCILCRVTYTSMTFE